MAAIIKGFSGSEIKPQPGFSLRQSEQGGWVGNHEFVIRADDFEDAQSSFAKGTLLADLDPDIPAPFDEFLRISEVELSRVEGDLIFFRVTCSGSGVNQFDLGDLGAEAEPTYTLTGQLTDSPFSNHRKWKALDFLDRWLLGQLLSGDFFYREGIIYLTLEIDGLVASIDQLSDNADAREFASRIQQGETTYQKSTYTWNESTEGDDAITPDQLSKLGLITEPRGEPPTPTGTRNWMLTSVSQSQTGELYRTTVEWTISDDGGHDEFLYEPEAPPEAP